MFAQGLTAALWPHFPASPEAQAEFGPVQCVRSADTSTGSSDPASAIKSKKKKASYCVALLCFEAFDGVSVRKRSMVFAKSGS